MGGCIIGIEGVFGAEDGKEGRDGDGDGDEDESLADTRLVASSLHITPEGRDVKASNIGLDIEISNSWTGRGM